MDGEANLPAPPAPPPAAPPLAGNSLVRPINSDPNLFRSFTSTSTSSSSSSSSPPEFLRHVQAAFKRHRSLVVGTMQSNNIRPRRLLVPQREISKSSTSNIGPAVDIKTTQAEVPLGHKVRDSIALAKNKSSIIKEAQEDGYTTGSTSGCVVNAYEESLRPFDVRKDQPRSFIGYENNDPVSSLLVESECVPLVEGQKKVQFAEENNSKTQEMEWDVSNQMEASTAISHDMKHQNFQNVEVGISLRTEGGITSLLTKRTMGVQDQQHQFGNFVQGDLNHPVTQSSVVGSFCATTTLVNSASAPMPSYPLSKYTSGMSADQTAVAACRPSLAVSTQLEVKEQNLSKEQQSSVPKEPDIPKGPSPHADKSTKGGGVQGDVTDVQSQAPLSKDPISDAKLELAKSGKQDKAASSKATSAPHKKSYDPDLFFKVNGKLYQRLGKIGSGGSSEVHKVISSDCKIYALKKIKLKGRDYATAYGFCQEIEYLNKLKGKSYIIQLIDYEVTDKALLQEVMNGSMSNKDGRVKDDGYIYMVLEYGEIDLAHMLSQKWKELDSSNSAIDENWLRFYWQQILLAVNTIHEERIVHSDLKPANFLLVKGSLKLIDFGIAKAIMSDTTNIQRDSQVGTLSYMSPEAFMCNETDANGNTIKCGRPSDIWSLGCILYQMVYGRTPFSEYKTFWAKFKVITDPNHEITFEAVSNPWLLDLMKKCLAWDRNERWRIPQLLQHPFLVPPIPPLLPSPQDQSCKLLQLISKSCANNPQALTLCCELQQILKDPSPAVTSQVSISQEQQRKLLCDISSLCFQLQEQLTTSEIR